MTRWLILALAFLWADDAFAQDAKTVADYFAQLETQNLIDPQSGDQKTLAKELADAESVLEAGDPALAATLLYAMVESPRYVDFADFTEYQNAEYDLAVALAASGAYEQALHYLERLLLRSPSSLYWAAAHRRAVDIAIERRSYQKVLAMLQSIKTNEPIPPGAAGERAYLKARLAYNAGRFPEAEGELVRIGKKSRMYSSALYLRGLIRTRRGALDDATDALCEIVDTPDTDKYAFVVDARYFHLRDLARLGLARLAHEQDRYDDAYYHYFQIPDDSSRLAEALFEGAWSMYQKRELDTSRDLVKELLGTFPGSSLLPEALLLAGYVELADCEFDAAQKRFDEVISRLQPVANETAKIARSPMRRRALMARAAQRARTDDKTVLRNKNLSHEQRVLALLQIDPQFLRLHDAAVGLRKEAHDAPRVVAQWRELGARMSRGKVKAIAQETTPEEDDARAVGELLRDIGRLRKTVQAEGRAVTASVRGGRLARDVGRTRLQQLESVHRSLVSLQRKTRTLSDQADVKLTRKATPKLRAMVTADMNNAHKLERASRALIERIDSASGKLASRALSDLHKNLRRVLDKAKLGKIDAVIGQKRRLEIEVQDLAQGRYPAELFGKLYEAGMIEDDEEYWPAEEEYWKDEYKGWR